MTAEKTTAEKTTAEKTTAEKTTAEKTTAEKTTAEKTTAEKMPLRYTLPSNLMLCLFPGLLAGLRFLLVGSRVPSANTDHTSSGLRATCVTADRLTGAQ